MTDLQIPCCITTAPRTPSYLQDTYVSLYDAGFPSIIFAEPNSQVFPGPTVIQWSEKKGAWHSWKAAVQCMLDSFPDSQHFLICQDDISVHPESKLLLNTFLQKHPSEFGYFSLYTPTCFTYRGSHIPKKPGITIMAIRAAYGACCLFFSRKTLQAIQTTKVWNSWLGIPAEHDPIGTFEKRQQDTTLVKHVDAAISQMLVELGLPMMYPVPSCCQHIGEFSSLGHAHAPIIPESEGISRRIAQRIVDYKQPILPQVFGVE